MTGARIRRICTFRLSCRHRFLRDERGFVEAGREPLERYERRRTTRRFSPRLEITELGFTLGAGTLLAKMAGGDHGRPRLAVSDEARTGALFAAAFGKPPALYALEKMRRAAQLWNAGEKALAHIHLAFARLPRCESEEQAFALFLAGECLDRGVPSSEVLKAQGFAPALLDLLKKYNPDQPRVPAGNGRASGQWTSGGSAAGGTGEAASSAGPAPVAPAAATAVSAESGTLADGLFGAASSEFLTGLSELGAALGGAGAVLGAIFVPSPNPGVTSEGEVPGDSGLHYELNHDEGTLRLTDAEGEIAAVARLGQGGIFYETETGEPVARDVGGSVVFDAEALETAALPGETSEATSQTADAAQTDTAEESPKLCPDPGPDAPHGASEQAQRYQEQISALNNPQRPLPAGLAVSLTDPVTGEPVAFDDCRESDGTMIEAKGPGYAKMLESTFLSDVLAEQWADQATRQLSATSGRAIEWYFAEQEAADKAQEVFDENNVLRGRIIVITVPAEVP